MFGPGTADSIEVSAHYYRKETEAWAANARLARLARAGEPGLVARTLSSLGSLFSRRVAAKPALPLPLARVAALRPAVSLVESEDDLFEGRRGEAAA